MHQPLDGNGKWSAKRAECVWHEVEAARQLMESTSDRPQQNSPFCRVHGIFFDKAPSQVMIVMELADRILHLEVRRYGSFSDIEVRTFARGLLQAGVWLQESEICHNDIKPANILLMKPGPGQAFRWQVKLSDFGSSCSVHKPRCRQLCTLNYAAPEILRTAALDVTGHGTTYPYTHSSDVWSIGVVVAELLSEDGSKCAVVPVEDPMMTTHEAYLSSMRSFIADLGVSLGHAACLDVASESNSGIGLVSNLAVMEPTARMPAKEALQHLWFTECATSAPLTVHGKDNAAAVKMSALGLGLARAFCLLTGIRGFCGVKWLGSEVRKSMDILQGHAAGFKEWGACLAEAYVKASVGKPDDWACHAEGRHRFYSGGAMVMI